MIDGLVVEKLKVVPRTEGELVEVLAPAADADTGIRHIHVSTIYPGDIKAWHYHPAKRETLVCLAGMLKLVFYDDREGSPTRGELREVFSGEQSYCRVSIPPGLKHAARAYGVDRVRVLVLSDKPFDPDVSDKTVADPPVDYDWTVKIT
jgi:dTDP-4-dehydrorhamnose 3,5-epimerase